MDYLGHMKVGNAHWEAVLGMLSVASVGDPLSQESLSLHPGTRSEMMVTLRVLLCEFRESQALAHSHAPRDSATCSRQLPPGTLDGHWSYGLP